MPKSRLLLSIRKEYSDLIFNGSKRFEYRKKLPKEMPSSFLVYESGSGGACHKVVGLVRVVGVMAGTPDEIWSMTWRHAGIGYEDFMKYFEGHQDAFAIMLERPRLFREPVSLSEFGLRRPPQSFCRTVDTRPRH